jgi:hypothetical protein
MNWTPYERKVATIIGVGSLMPSLPRLAAMEFANEMERLEGKAKQDYYGKSNPVLPPSDIDFARLSINVYNKDPSTEGFTIIHDLTSPDRVVYQHDRTKHVVLAFRGTDPTNPRDLVSDAILAMGNEEISHRFFNAEEITKKTIARYGKNNVTVTGHSLGGSQAMHVSRKYKVHAEVYDPHVEWQSAITGTNYPDVALHTNKYDPIAAFYRGAHFQSVDARNSYKHSIDNFVRAVPTPQVTSHQVNPIKVTPPQVISTKVTPTPVIPKRKRLKDRRRHARTST